MIHSGGQETSGTPTTPITPDNSNPPSPMLNRDQLTSPRRGNFPGSPIVQPPQSPREKPKHGGQATVKKMPATESLATSQMKQQLNVPSPKQACQPTSEEIYVQSSERLTTSQAKQQLPSQAIVSTFPSMSQKPSATSLITMTTATKPKTQHTPISTNAEMSVSYANVATQQATPTKVVQTSAKSSPIVKSTCNSELVQSSNASTKTVAQPQAAKLAVNSLSAAALTRPPLRRQQMSSTNNSVISQTLTKQPPKSIRIQPQVSASSMPSVSAAQVRSKQKSASSITGIQPQKASTLQPPLQQSRPIMSPTVSQTASSASMPNTSVSQVRNTQQNSFNVAVTPAQTASTSQALPQQQIPVMVGLNNYPPTVQQLQALAMMGVQVPMYNIPLILQDPNQQSPVSVSYSTAGTQAAQVSTQTTSKHTETHKTGVSAVATKVAPQLKPQQNITATSSSANSSQNIKALGSKGGELKKSLKKQTVSNQDPNKSVVSSNVSTPTSEKSVTVAQKTPTKSHMSAEHTKLTASEKSVTTMHKTPSKSHSSVEHTKSGLSIQSSNSQAQEVTYLFTDTTSASKTAPPMHANSTPTASSYSLPAQKSGDTTNTTSAASKKALPKSGGRSASKQAAQPMRHNSTPATGVTTISHQTVISSPKSIIQHAPQTPMSAKKSLSFSSSATTSSNRGHDALQTTPTSSRAVQNSPVLSKGAAAPKPSAKTENSSSTFSTTTASNNRQKVPAVQSLLCTVCQLTPQNPLRSECCGALYCESCSRRLDKCPQHKCQLRLRRDTELFNMIQKQHTKCKYAGNGCTWRGRVAEQKQHISVCIYNPSSELHSK